MLGRFYFALLGRHLLRSRIRGFHAGPRSLVDRRSALSPHNRLYGACQVIDSTLGRHTYATDSRIANATVGKFCSIGPGTLIGGLGRHPTRWMSTHPVFYSPRRQSGISFTSGGHFEELPRTFVGNDVWIGARAIVLDGVTIGDGAIVAAGAVVSRNVQPYSVVGGVPAVHLRFRMDPELVPRMLALRWWDWPETLLQAVATHFRAPPSSEAVDALQSAWNDWRKSHADPLLPPGQ